MRSGAEKKMGLCVKSRRPIWKNKLKNVAGPRSYTLNELPQPQVLLTFGLLNLNPAPSSDAKTQ